MKICSVANFTATNLKTPGPVFAAAARGPVRIEIPGLATRATSNKRNRILRKARSRQLAAVGLNQVQP